MTKKPTPKATKPAKATKPVNKSRSTTPKKVAPKVVRKPRVTAPKPVRAIEPSPAPIIIEEFIAPPQDSALRTHDDWRGYTSEDRERFVADAFQVPVGTWANRQWNAAIQDTQATPPTESEPRSHKVLYVALAIGAALVAGIVWYGSQV